MVVEDLLEKMGLERDLVGYIAFGEEGWREEGRQGMAEVKKQEYTRLFVGEQ